MRQERARARYQRKRSKGQKIALWVILLVLALVGAGVGIVAHFPGQTLQLVHQIMPAGGPADAAVSDDDGPVAGEAADKTADPEAVKALEGTPTRQIAACGDVKLYSPIVQKELTGVLFHQASYNTALKLTTELPDANPEAVSVDHPVRVNHKQKKGDWVDADALHLYRTQDTTEMDTAIDVGAKVGTTVFAPVTGTVVLV